MKTFWLIVGLSAGAWLARAENVVLAPRNLTLREAQQLALKQHPRISVARLLALAAQEQTRQVRSALLPTVMLEATAAGVADAENTRIVAGEINNPRIFDREADGVSISQLITDFGRTWELTKSARLNARSQEMNVEATQAAVLLEVNNAYFSSLSSQSVLKVAQQTLDARRLVFQQTQALTTNKLKSELDLSFAAVDLDQAGIMVAKARSDLLASFAVLSDVLGEPKPEEFVLADAPLPPLVTNDYSALLFEALQHRPDLAQLRYQRDSAHEFARAQRKLNYPTVSAVGVAGVVPIGDSQLNGNDEGAGINLSLPLYTGGLNAGKRHEAELRARAADESVRDEEDTIARDVQITILNLEYSYERVTLTEQLFRNANEALELAQARFKVGATSIIELSQAELNQTSAQISEASARYDYQIQRSALDFQLGRLR